MSRTHKRRSVRDLTRDLRTIYAGADGSMPDLSKLSRKRRSTMTSVLLKIIVLLFGLSALAWAGFFLFNNGGLFQSNESLKVEIEGPDNIKSGEPVSYTIRYKNTGDVPIASLEMKLNTPNSFYVLTTAPEPTDPQQWTIGALKEGSDGAITLNGVFLSEVPSSQRMQVLFTYKPANFNSAFQKIETKTVQISESVLKMTVGGPQKALAGDKIAYTLNLQNTGQVDVFNVRVFPELPADFTINTTTPNLPETEGYWTLDLLKAGELKELGIAGTFTTTASGEQQIGARASFVKEELVLDQTKQTVTTDVLGGALAFRLIMDGSDKDQTVSLGKTLRGSIDFSNNGVDAAEDVRFTLRVETQQGTLPINFVSALVSNGVRTGSTIVWTGKNIDALKRLEPKASGVIDFSLPIIEAIDNKNADRFTVTLSAEIGRVGSITTARTIEATPITVLINSNVQATANARYFSTDGEAIGGGPLPPNVGQTTRLRIQWNLTNSLHALKDIVFETTLPQDVTFDEKKQTDIGELTFNTTTRQVRWVIPKLPVDIPTAEAWFDVAITPTKEDVASFFKLTNQISFVGKDTITGDELNRSLDPLSTDLESDALAKGKGVVTE